MLFLTKMYYDSRMDRMEFLVNQILGREKKIMSDVDTLTAEIVELKDQAAENKTILGELKTGLADVQKQLADALANGSPSDQQAALKQAVTDLADITAGIKADDVAAAPATPVTPATPATPVTPFTPVEPASSPAFSPKYQG